jgi:hypothetical protein
VRNILTSKVLSNRMHIATFYGGPSTLFVTSMFFCSSWQVRRVVWTEDMLVCAQIDMTTVIDAISLAEVTSIQFVQNHAIFGHQPSISKLVIIPHTQYTTCRPSPNPESTVQSHICFKRGLSVTNLLFKYRSPYMVHKTYHVHRCNPSFLFSICADNLRTFS